MTRPGTRRLSPTMKRPSGVKVGQPRSTCRIPAVGERRVERCHLLGEFREHRPVGLDLRRLAAELVVPRIAGTRIRLPATEQERVDVGPTIERGIRHPEGRQLGAQPVDRHADDVFVAHRHDRQIDAGKARDVPGVSAGGDDDLGAADPALLGLDRGDRIAAQRDARDADIRCEAHAGSPRMLAVRHREIVGLQIAIARAPEDRLGVVGDQTWPARLSGRVVEQLALGVRRARSGREQTVELGDPRVSQRDPEAADLAPVRRRAVVLLQAAEGRDRVHREPDPVRRAADLAHKPRRLRRGRGGERRVLLEQEHIGDAGFGKSIRDRAPDGAAAHDYDLGVADFPHFRRHPCSHATLACGCMTRS